MAGALERVRYEPDRLIFEFIVLFTISSSLIASGHEELEAVKVQDVSKRLHDSCILLVLPPTKEDFRRLLKSLLTAFSSEPKVSIAVLQQRDAYSHAIQWKDDRKSASGLDDLAFYAQKRRDRACLIPAREGILKAERYKGPRTFEALLEFLNTRCGTFRSADGRLSRAGQARESILSNLFRVPSSNDAQRHAPGVINIGASCERISMPAEEEFLQQYLFRSKPVIITDALESWPALQKWTNKFLDRQFGKNDVRVAFAPNGDYEGCEKASSFEDYINFNPPEVVKNQLPFSDLVVVRPAFRNMNFSSFMEIVERPSPNVSAYLEYSSIPSLLPELVKDVNGMPFVLDTMQLQHLNIWLSDGNTLGKLHFDPFDNFLCQVSGRKQVILYEPHDNTRLYEAHIQEASLSYNHKAHTFLRKKLMDSTSMVMSPVDIMNPNYHRFPKFREVRAMNCTISEGDVLFMPAFWWHEVQSYPSQEQRNLAVNYWYEPFLTREYPCPSCKLDVNPHYRQLLEKFRV